MGGIEEGKKHGECWNAGAKGGTEGNGEVRRDKRYRNVGENVRFQGGRT